MEATIQKTIRQLFAVDTDVVLTRPDPQFGDYATNVALQLAKKLGKSPREVAEAITGALRDSGEFAEVTVAGPGFINLRVKDEQVWDQAMKTTVAAPVQRLLLEYSCPNPFKEVHTGHMYQTFLGDALGRLYERAGTTVYRANFGGDVGMHVGKAMWGIIQALDGEYSEKLADVPEAERSAWLAKAYVAGSAAYEDDSAKQTIEALNTRIYQLHADNDHDSPLARIYWTCRQWSYTYFKALYAQLRVTSFDHFYPESQTAVPGLAMVRANIGPVFTESEGAIVLPKETSGLHTRVFINSRGLPLYEAKDLGVIQLEAKDFAYDQRIIMIGQDQAEYMKVVFAALRLCDPQLGAKQSSLVNGTVRFGDGKKMSSRLGNVARAVDVVAAVHDAVQADNDTTREQIALGALKYSLLKNRIGGDIAFDLDQSVSLEGNSGPYLQYAAVRAASILAKAPQMANNTDTVPKELDEHERSLASQLSQYSDALAQALADRSPHHICSYLYALAQTFNRFYEHGRVVGDEREALRVQLVRRYHAVLVEGLNLMGIDVPEKM